MSLLSSGQREANESRLHGMRRLRTRGPGWAIGCTVILWSQLAFAGDDRWRWTLEWRAAEGCPDRAAALRYIEAFVGAEALRAAGRATTVVEIRETASHRWAASRVKGSTAFQARDVSFPQSGFSSSRWDSRSQRDVSAGR
jgi:hypothetical protein